MSGLWPPRQPDELRRMLALGGDPISMAAYACGWGMACAHREGRDDLVAVMALELVRVARAQLAVASDGVTQLAELFWWRALLEFDWEYAQTWAWQAWVAGR